MTKLKNVLFDGQALLVQRSWVCPNVLAVCTRGYGKSTVIDLEIMAKDMCFCNVWTYIASGTGGQAEQTFTTLERLANDNIDTFYGSTGSLFKNEIEIKNFYDIIEFVSQGSSVGESARLIPVRSRVRISPLLFFIAVLRVIRRDAGSEEPQSIFAQVFAQLSWNARLPLA